MGGARSRPERDAHAWLGAMASENLTRTWRKWQGDYRPTLKEHMFTKFS